MTRVPVYGASWLAFARCGECHALAGEPCIDRRQWLAGYPRPDCKIILSPHRGRRQLGPRARR